MIFQGREPGEIGELKQKYPWRGPRSCRGFNINIIIIIIIIIIIKIIIITIIIIIIVII